jgi:uridine kinase
LRLSQAILQLLPNWAPLPFSPTFLPNLVLALAKWTLQDSFYKELTPEQMTAAHNNDYDFDAPDSIDMELMCSTLQKLKEGQRIQVPCYDFSKHARDPKKNEMLYGSNVVIVEGLFAIREPIASLLDVKVFVDDPEDVRLERRLKRDVEERGRDREGCLKQYHRYVKPSFDKYIQPTLCTADIVVPRGVNNTIAMGLLLDHVRKQMADREIGIRKTLSAKTITGALPDTVSVMEQTPQVVGMHTIIRNADVSREDFVFYSERLMRVLMEHANSFLPYSTDVVRREGALFRAAKRLSKPVVGVSVLTSGLCMESTFRSVHMSANVGKILIQTNPRSEEPELHYCKLPELDGRACMLLDAQIVTGAAAMMAVRVLLDHGANEEDIIFVTLVSSPLGAQSLAEAFPKIRIVAAAVDERTEGDWTVPGIGHFAQRYFGNERLAAEPKSPMKESPKAARQASSSRIERLLEAASGV